MALGFVEDRLSRLLLDERLWRGPLRR